MGKWIVEKRKQLAPMLVVLNRRMDKIIAVTLMVAG